MDDAERRRQAKADADSLIQAGRITTDAELDAFMSSRGVKPMAADATAVQPVDYGAKYDGARQMLPGEGMVRQAARGATLGLSDRMLAGIAAGLDPNTDYATARTRIDNENRRYEAESPAMALGANLVGGALPAAPANLLARGVSNVAGRALKGSGVVRDMARTGGTAATMGAAGGVGYQSGADDQSIERTVANALFGAKVGGGLGALAPVVGRAGGIAADLTGARMAGKPLQPNTVPTLPGGGTANPLTREFWSGQNAKQLLSRGEGLLYPTPAGRMVDQKMIGLADDAGRSSVGEAQAAYRELDDLTNNAMVLDVLGDRGNRAARGARTIGTRASGTFNDAFDARRATLSANMEDDVNTIIAQRENVPQGVQARRDVRSQNAKAAYEPVMGDKVPLSPESVGTLTEDPQKLWQQAWDAGAMTAKRDMPSRTIPPLFGQVDDGNGNMRRGLLREPTVEDIDTMKKGLNVVINNRGDAANAQVRNDAGALKRRLDALLEETDAASPGYAAARKQFGDDSEMMEAFQGMAEGVNSGFREVPRFSQATRDQVQNFFGGLSAAGKGEAQRGIAQDLFRVIDTDAKRALTQAASPSRTAFRQKMDIAFADKPGVSDELARKWTARDIQEKNAAFIQGGSPTADKLMDGVEAASLPGRVGQLTYAPERGLAALLGQKAISGLQKTMADELATRAVLGGDEGAAYLRYLSDYGKQLTNRAGARRAMTGRGIGTGIGMRNALAALLGREDGTN